MSVSTIDWDRSGFQQALKRRPITRLTLALKIKFLPFNGYKPTLQVLVVTKAKSAGSACYLPKFTGWSQVTVFGESAGAVSIGILFLNSGFEKLARAAVSHRARLSGFQLLRKHSLRFWSLVQLTPHSHLNLFADRVFGMISLNLYPAVPSLIRSRVSAPRARVTYKEPSLYLLRSKPSSFPGSQTLMDPMAYILILPQTFTRKANLHVFHSLLALILTKVCCSYILSSDFTCLQARFSRRQAFLQMIVSGTGSHPTSQLTQLMALFY